MYKNFPPIPLFLLALFFIPLLITSCRAAHPTPAATLPDPHGWKLVFSDEFNGHELDTTKWNTCYPWVEDGGCTNSGNNELEWYQPDEVSVQDGLLRLRAQDRSVKEGFPYTSGMVTSHRKFSFQYGYVEARFKVPAGQGMWPALWLLPENEQWPPEIDILEVLGNAPSTIYTTLHYTTNGTDHYSSGSSWRGYDFSAGFHTIGLLWEPHLIAWIIDGVERFSVTDNVPQEPFYFLANLAVGGNWPGSPNASTVFPGYFEIDFIRIYQNDAYMATAAEPTPSPSGGKNIVHAAKIRAVDEYGQEIKEFTSGTIYWQVQVVNQDGVPYSGARVTVELLDQDGNVKLQIPNWEATNRLGWVTFTALVKDPGKYTIRVTDITTFSINASYDPQKDSKPVKITVK
jgi:beta-glucanase (GH16 family)